MLFKLVATVYLLMNGQPVGDPMPLTNKVTFDTLEACVEFKDSDRGAHALEQLNDLLAARLKPEVTHTVTVSCEKGEDGSI